MKTLSDYANQPGSPKGSTTPTVNAATSEQIHTLLHAATCMSQHLLSPDDEAGEKDSRDSASATFINITNRLDAILSEANRWEVSKYDEVTENLSRMYKAQAEYMEKAAKLADADRKRMARMDAPHQRRGVSVHVLNDGRFMVCDGDPSISSSVKAVGESPELAAKEFDMIWLGELPYQPFSVKVPNNSNENTGGLMK